MDLSSLYDKFDLVSDPSVSEEDLGAYIEQNCDAAMAEEIGRLISGDPYIGELARDAVSFGASAASADEMVSDSGLADVPGFEDDLIDIDGIELPAFPGDDIESGEMFPDFVGDTDDPVFGSDDFPLVAGMPEDDFFGSIPDVAAAPSDYDPDFGADAGLDFGTDFAADSININDL